MSPSRSKTSSSSSKKTKRIKTEVPSEPAPVVEVTPTVEPETTTPDVETEAPAVEAVETYSAIRNLIFAKERLLKEVLIELGRLNKRLDNAHKRESKKTKKVQRASKNKEEKKHVVIDSLATLMGEEVGFECSRKEIQRFICKYVRENKLQKEGYKKCFIPDAALKEVLGEPQFTVNHKDGTSTLDHSYTNLMKLLSFLFKEES